MALNFNLSYKGQFDQNMLAAGVNGALILRALNRGEELEAEYARKENF